MFFFWDKGKEQTQSAVLWQAQISLSLVVGFVFQGTCHVFLSFLVFKFISFIIIGLGFF